MSYGTPLRGDPGYYYGVGIDSPSTTPSPHYYPPYTSSRLPPRPATRQHVRGASGGYNDYRPSTAFSPRYKSNGEYATGPSPKVSSTRKPSFSKGSHHVPKRERRSSYSYHRTPYGDSDEDEILEVEGLTFVWPAQSRSRRYQDYFYPSAPGHRTDHYYNPQGFANYYDGERDDARYEDPLPRSSTRVGHRSHHSRRPSQPVPARPSTTRPSLVHQRPAAVQAPKATEADAKKHKIPVGYSLKNWDPTEEPIMLLGSVFDANSLGKWIYDWTVYHHGPATPIADISGELWLLLIQLSGKVKRSEEVMSQVRVQEKRELVDDFIQSGERLLDRLRSLLKRCEAPMLKASKRKDVPQLGKNAGVEFVETLFGRERELEKTERLMAALRLWNLRFDANCEDILKKPTA